MSTKIKILIVTSSISSQNGGVTTSILNYYKALKKFKHIDMTVASTVLPNETEYLNDNIVNDENFNFFETSDKRWRYSKDMNQFFKQEIEYYDLVWIHGIWLSQSFFASKYATKKHVPYIITPHGSLQSYAIKIKSLKKNIYWYLIEKYVFRKASFIHCLTDFEKKEVQKMINNKIFVLPNTVEAGEFEVKDYAQLQSICFIGRLHPNKGLDLLLEALKNKENIKLLIAGEGELEYKEYIYSLVKKFKIENRVVFFGYANETLQKEIYKQSLFCVIPSYSEALSMVGLEALAHSTPVLTTAQCNFEIISEYNAGVVIKNNELEVLGEGITEMISKDIREMSKNAHDLCKEHFDFEVVGKRLLERLELIIK